MVEYKSTIQLLNKKVDFLLSYLDVTEMPTQIRNKAYRDSERLLWIRHQHHRWYQRLLPCTNS